MASKKIYASPEIEVIKFSFENILASGTNGTGYIKESKDENKFADGDIVDDEEFC